MPNLQSDIRWDEVSARLVAGIVARLEEYLLPGLSANILAAFHRTPLDLKSECSLPFGAGFSRQVTKPEFGKEFFPHVDPDLDNLYLVGHYTMPGPGLNAALMSAQFASAQIPASQWADPGRTQPPDMERQYKRVSATADKEGSVESRWARGKTLGFPASWRRLVDALPSNALENKRVRDSGASLPRRDLPGEMGWSSRGIGDISFRAVPEPTTALHFASGLRCFAIGRRLRC